MGNFYCCAFDGEDKANITLHQLGTSGLKEVPPKVYEAWLRRYKEGGAVEVLFPDGQRIECKLTLDAAKKFLLLAFKEKVREIPYKDIDSWIYGPSVIEQSSADAKLLKDPNVVGFRLSTSGRAIAVSFDSVDNAVCFVRFLDQVLEECRAEELQPAAPKTT